MFSGRTVAVAVTMWIRYTLGHPDNAGAWWRLALARRCWDLVRLCTPHLLHPEQPLRQGYCMHGIRADDNGLSAAALLVHKLARSAAPTAASQLTGCA
jgi:hypothetical protein